METVKQGAGHKRVPNDVADHPVLVGHEFAGDIVKVGKKWQDQFKPGQKLLSSRRSRDRWSLPDILISTAAVLQPTVFSQMISLKRDVYGHLKETATLMLPWQSRCAASSAVTIQITTRFREAMST